MLLQWTAAGLDLCCSLGRGSWSSWAGHTFSPCNLSLGHLGFLTAQLSQGSKSGCSKGRSWSYQSLKGWAWKPASLWHGNQHGVREPTQAQGGGSMNPVSLWGMSWNLWPSLNCHTWRYLVLLLLLRIPSSTLCPYPSLLYPHCPPCLMTSCLCSCCPLPGMTPLPLSPQHQSFLPTCQVHISAPLIHGWWSTPCPRARLGSPHQWHRTQ